MDVHDPLVRRYILTHEFHMSWYDQDEASAVELDEMLILHGRINQESSEG